MNSFRTLYATEPAKAIRFLDFFLAKDSVKYQYRTHHVVASISGALYSHRLGRHFTTFEEWVERVYGSIPSGTDIFQDIYVGRESLGSISEKINKRSISSFLDKKFRSFTFYNYIKDMLENVGVEPKEKEPFTLVWNDNKFTVSLRNVGSESKSPLDILHCFEAGLLDNLWYLPQGSSQLVCLLSKQEKMKHESTTETVCTTNPNMYPVYSTSLLPTPMPPSTMDHFLFQSNLLNKSIQEIGTLQQLCQRQQQIIESLEKRLASLETANLPTRLSVLEEVDSEGRLNFLESLVPPPQQPVTYLPVYPVQQTPVQHVDPMSAMMQAIQMAQMVQAASQQSAMLTNQG